MSSAGEMLNSFRVTSMAATDAAATLLVLRLLATTKTATIEMKMANTENTNGTMGQACSEGAVLLRAVRVLVGELIGGRRFRHGCMLVVIVQDVIFDFVVIAEDQLAEWALVYHRV